MQLILKISIKSSHYVKYKTNTYIHMLKKPNKPNFQIQTPDLLFQCLDWNAGLKCTASGPELALAVSWVTSAVYFTTHSSSGRAYCFELSTAQTLCACWLWKQHSYFHIVMHLETEHLADAPLLGLGQQGRPYNTYYHSWHPQGSWSHFKELPPLAANVKEYVSQQLFCHSLKVLKTYRTKNL